MDEKDKVKSLFEHKQKLAIEREEQPATLTLTMTRFEWVELLYCIEWKRRWVRENAEELIDDHGDPSFPDWWVKTFNGAEEKLAAALHANGIEF